MFAYPLSVLLATLHLGGLAVTALFIVLVAGFRWENQTAESAAADNWLLVFAPVLFVAGLATLTFVIRREWRRGASVFALQAVAASVLVIYALRESVHSDHQLIAWTLAVEAVGYGAVALSARPAPGSSERPS